MNDNNPVTGYDVMHDIVERLRQVQGDNDDAREAAAEIARLHEEVKQTRMRIADLEKQLFRATGRTP